MRRPAVVFLLATFVLTSCVTTDDDPNKNAKRGAAIGATAGAILGAIIGNQTGGNARTGAILGAAAGAALGGATGHDMDKQQRELQQIPGVTEVTRPTPTEITVFLPSDVLFDVDSYALRPESREALREVADNIARYPGETVSVEGHTDATGSPEHNQLLSVNRANAVRSYLIDQGIQASVITTSGFGATMPKTTNDTPEGRQVNRRVEIHIHAKANG